MAYKSYVTKTAVKKYGKANFFTNQPAAIQHTNTIQAYIVMKMYNV